MTRMSRTIVVLAGTIVLTLSGGPVALTSTGSGSQDRGAGASDADALTRATEAALAVTGGGRVTDAETGDEESWYEVEVTLDDGRLVEVQLDRDLRVVSRSGGAERSEDGPLGD